MAKSNREIVNWFDIDASNEVLIKTNGKINCPNCGAPIESEKCQYCGSIFIDFGTIETDIPFFLKIRHNDKTYIYKVKLNSIDVEQNGSVFYCDNGSIINLPAQNELNLNFSIL